jgi:hypothetical protein
LDLLPDFAPARAGVNAQGRMAQFSANSFEAEKASSRRTNILPAKKAGPGFIQTPLRNLSAID